MGLGDPVWQEWRGQRFGQRALIAAELEEEKVELTILDRASFQIDQPNGEALLSNDMERPAGEDRQRFTGHIGNQRPRGSGILLSRRMSWYEANREGHDHHTNERQTPAKVRTWA